jgi:hypothetical protein
MWVVVAPDQVRLDAPADGVYRRNLSSSDGSRTITQTALLPDDDRRRRLQGHALSTLEPDQHFVMRGSCRQTFEFGQEVIGERLPCACGADLEPAVQGGGTFRI